MTYQLRITHKLKTLATILLLSVLSGCSALSYYNQSIMGQVSVIYNREDFDSILNDPEADTVLKNKLTRVKIIRRFATERLLLPDNKSYLYYADVKRPYVVTNVFAAPEFSLTPVNWCYPVVGCVSYRGYFNPDDAQNHAVKLSKEGNDTHVAGIAAYSTLGWFDDPLLNTMINWRERALAGLIFHELSHQVLYFSNETAFNEAFSSAVERIGSIQWLIHNNPNQLQHYLLYLDAQNDFRNLLSDIREELKEVYISTDSIQKKRKLKSQIIGNLKIRYTELKHKWPETIHFDYWFNKPVNNARFTSSMTYLQQIPAFYTLFIESNGDWAHFFTTIKNMENLRSEDRKILINSKLDNSFDLNKIVTLLSEKI